MTFVPRALLLVLVAALPVSALAQGVPPKGQPAPASTEGDGAKAKTNQGGESALSGLNLRTSGLDELDDDLLDPDLGEVLDPKEAAATSDIAIPPPEARAAIDASAAEVGRSGARMAQELEELMRLMREDQARADAEVERRLAESEGRLNTLRGELVRLSARLDGEEAREAERRRVRGYGTPLDMHDMPSGSRFADYRGRDEDQFKWWQKLLLKVMEGIDAGLKGLAERRANEVKAAADALALSTDPRYREYADEAVRRELEASGLTGLRAPAAVGDARLNDLLLPGRSNPAPLVRRANGAMAPVPGAVSQPGAPAFSGDTLGSTRSVKVVLLPRVRDPITGNERIVIDYPLGMPPLR